MYWKIWLICLQLSWLYPVDIRSNLRTYCRERERLITSEDFDEFSLIDVELNSTLKLDCHFCNEKDNSQPKLWFYQDRYQEKHIIEVKFGMENNMYNNRIYQTPEFNLVFRNFEISDAGIYRCHGEQGQEAENKFNFRLETAYKEFEDLKIETGNISDWEQYRERNLMPVTKRFSVSRMRELVQIRSAGVVLEVITTLSPWGPCDNCIKTSRAKCRLKGRIVDEV